MDQLHDAIRIKHYSYKTEKLISIGKRLHLFGQLDPIQRLTTCLDSHVADPPQRPPPAAHDFSRINNIDWHFLIKLR
jgi:hypothetical protein